MTLRAYQESMANYLRELETDPPPSTIASAHPVEQCLQIYRNHYFVSLIDAIKSTFPVTCQYLSEKVFYSKARGFVAVYPPESGCLANYGHRFPDWLACEYDKAGALASFEWLLERTSIAPCPKPFPFQSLAGLSADQYPQVHFYLAQGVKLFEAEWDVINLYDSIKNKQTPHTLTVKNQTNERFAWLIYRQPDGVGVYPADSVFSAVITLCQLDKPLAALGDSLSTQHVEAILAMVEKGIIDSFDSH